MIRENGEPDKGKREIKGGDLTVKENGLMETKGNRTVRGKEG